MDWLIDDELHDLVVVAAAVPVVSTVAVGASASFSHN